MNLSVISGFAAFILYGVACLILYRQYRGQQRPSRASVLAPGGLAVLAHGLCLWQIILTPQGLQLGVFPVASTVAFAGALFVSA